MPMSAIAKALLDGVVFKDEEGPARRCFRNDEVPKTVTQTRVHSPNENSGRYLGQPPREVSAKAHGASAQYQDNHLSDSESK